MEQCLLPLLLLGAMQHRPARLPALHWFATRWLCLEPGLCIRTPQHLQTPPCLRDVPPRPCLQWLMSSIGDPAAPFPRSGFAAVECKPTSAASHCKKPPNPSPAVPHCVVFFFLPCSQELLSRAHQGKALDEDNVPRSARVWLLRAQLQHQQVKGALQPQHRGLSVNSQLWLDFKGLVGGLLQWIRS